MTHGKSPLQILTALTAAGLVGAVVAATFLAPAMATHSPANKMSVSASTIDVTEPGEVIEILVGSMKTATTTDVIVSLSLECSILTQVTTVGNDLSEAQAKIVAWVEIDGVPVGVNEGDNGEVVMCDRTHRQTTSLFDDDDATIESYLATRSAHSFNWIALNLGNGDHTIVAKAMLTEVTSDDDALADAVIGKRTLIVEPTKLANDITV